MGGGVEPTEFEVVEPLGERSCVIRVGHGVATAADLIPPRYERAAILAQPATIRLAGSIAAASEARVSVRELPDREAAKSLAVVGDVYEWLNTLGLTRGDLIVGVGGGAVSDVTGFVAATYLRGVAVRYVATTLLAAVDAAIGGKTGINVAGKNLAGVFRHPDAVLVDLSILERLPEAIKREGSAEALKAGLIGDPGLVAVYERDGLDAALGVVVPAAIKVKVDVVNDDFREGGQRAVLNYGHTIGHALEVEGELPHGHAIAIGMVAAGAVAEAKLGFGGGERQLEVIESLGLPVRAPDLDRTAVHHWIGLDKKRDRSGIRMVLLEEVGRPIVATVTEEELGQGLDAIGLRR
jgi:3-dehydroquinate synthetase